MPKDSYKHGKRHSAPLGRIQSSVEFLPALDNRRMRSDGERRSKHQEDDRRLNRTGKAPARQYARPSKKQKVVVVGSEDDEDVEPLGDEPQGALGIFPLDAGEYLRFSEGISSICTELGRQRCGREAVILMVGNNVGKVLQKERTEGLPQFRLDRKAIFTAGYKAVLHIHSIVEECELRVVSLRNNMLTGPFPGELCNCNHVHALYLGYNDFYGPVPNLTAFWPRLTHVILQYNRSRIMLRKLHLWRNRNRACLRALKLRR